MSSTDTTQRPPIGSLSGSQFADEGPVDIRTRHAPSMDPRGEGTSATTSTIPEIASAASTDAGSNIGGRSLSQPGPGGGNAFSCELPMMSGALPVSPPLSPVASISPSAVVVTEVPDEAPSPGSGTEQALVLLRPPRRGTSSPSANDARGFSITSVRSGVETFGLPVLQPDPSPPGSVVSVPGSPQTPIQSGPIDALPPDDAPTPAPREGSPVPSGEDRSTVAPPPADSAPAPPTTPSENGTEAPTEVVDIPRPPSRADSVIGPQARNLSGSGSSNTGTTAGTATTFVTPAARVPAAPEETAAQLNPPADEQTGSPTEPAVTFAEPTSPEVSTGRPDPQPTGEQTSTQSRPPAPTPTVSTVKSNTSDHTAEVGDLDTGTGNPTNVPPRPAPEASSASTNPVATEPDVQDPVSAERASDVAPKTAQSSLVGPDTIENPSVTLSILNSNANGGASSPASLSSARGTQRGGSSVRISRTLATTRFGTLVRSRLVKSVVHTIRRLRKLAKGYYARWRAWRKARKQERRDRRALREGERAKKLAEEKAKRDQEKQDRARRRAERSARRKAWRKRWGLSFWW